MPSQKTKSILLLCAAFAGWIIVDTSLWIYLSPKDTTLILRHNGLKLFYGAGLSALFGMVQVGILNHSSKSRGLKAAGIAVTVPVFAFALAYLNDVFGRFVVSGMFGLSLTQGVWSPFFHNLVLFLALAGLLYVTHYRRLNVLQQQQLLQARALADEAQLLMLRYQINPHFLFNALNAIQSMIEKDKETAKDMIADLSDYFRYTLSKTDQTLVPLREEIEAVRKYLAIQKERFGGRISIGYEFEEGSLDVKVPFFIVHPLVENAIKYGFNGSPETLQVVISAVQEKGVLTIVVKNTGTLVRHDQPSTAGASGTKTGLANIPTRLDLFYPGRSSLELSGNDEWVHARIVIKNPERTA